MIRSQGDCSKFPGKLVNKDISVAGEFILSYFLFFNKAFITVSDCMTLVWQVGSLIIIYYGDNVR